MSVSSRLFQQFAAELRRRKVLRVVAVYAVVAWVLLQLAEIAFEPLGYPDWALRALIISAIVGFPVTFILAWVIDIRPEGLIFDLPLFSTGEQEPRQRKKYDIPLALSLVLILFGGSYYLVNQLLDKDFNTEQPSAESSEAADASIAVLAFESFSDDEDTDYFAAGLADEILQLLSGVSELNVTSRTSSFQFKGQQIDIRDVAQKLDVTNILEGTARQQDNRIRISARLMDGRSGYNKWANSFERALDDIFAIQREIAQSVVSELKVVLSVDSQRHLDKQATQSTSAYLEYLEGLGRLRSSLDADVMQVASAKFRSALDADDSFAKAYAGLCEAHLRLYEINRGLADFEIAETACEESSRLDPGLNAAVGLALGKLYGYRGWYERAEAQLNKAIALNPEPIDEYLELSRIRMGQGRREEAEQLLNKAHAEKPNYWATHEALGSFYYRNDRYPEAIQEYSEAILMAPNVATTHAAKGAAHWMHGEFDNAIEAYEASLAIKPSRQAHTNVGLLHFYAGRFDQAVLHQSKALEYAPNDYRVWGRLGEAYYYLPNKEDAQHAFERAVELANDNLDVNASSWRTLALQATYLAYLGKFESATEAATKAIESSNDSAESYYSMAQVRALAGQKELARKAIARAIEIDPSHQQLVEGEPLFKTLLVDSE